MTPALGDERSNDKDYPHQTRGEGMLAEHSEGTLTYNISITGGSRVAPYFLLKSYSEAAKPKRGKKNNVPFFIPQKKKKSVLSSGDERESRVNNLSLKEEIRAAPERANGRSETGLFPNSCSANEDVDR